MFGKKKANTIDYDDVNYDPAVEELYADDSSYGEDTAGYVYDYDTTDYDDYDQSDTGNGKTGGGYMPKQNTGLKGLIVVLGMILLIAVLYTVVTSVLGPRRGECKSTIATMQEGINELDVEKAISVIHPDVKRPLQALILVGEAATNTDASSVITSVINRIGADIIPSDSNEPVTDLLGKMEIVPYSYGFPGMTRNVKCRIQYDGTTYQYVKIKLKKYQGETYIDSIAVIKKR